MKKFSVVSALIALVAVLCTASFAGTEYVITNDNAIPNTATVYQLDTATGALTEFAVLHTGGKGEAQVDPTNTQQAITQNAGCIFVMNDGSGDIASFSRATNYARVGNYSNSAVASPGSLAVTPNGMFLYASYSESENIGAWAVNADCSLSFIAGYIPSFGLEPLANIAVSPNGRYLAVSVVGELFGIDQTTGALADLGYIKNCRLSCGVAGGVDFTKDSKIAVFGAILGGEPGAVFSEVTPTGFLHAEGLSFSSLGIRGEVAPFFSAAGYAGSGALYFGAMFGSGFHPAAVITTDFTEKPPNVLVTQVTVISTPSDQIGPIVATGDLMVIPLYPNQIGVYSINSDGSLTQLSLTTDVNALAMFSLSVFPNTR